MESLHEPLYDFLIIRRVDNESRYNVSIWEPATKKRFGGRYSYLIVDWFNYQNQPAKNLKSLAQNRKLLIRQIYSQAKVIITDRLHASILAVLMDKPHVIIDDKFNKISNTRDLAFEQFDECDAKYLRAYYARDIDAALKQGVKVLMSIEKFPKKETIDYQFGQFN